MKRYLLFAFDDEYPSGGWDDFRAASNDLEQLKRDYSEGDNRRNMAQIVDAQTMQVVLINNGFGWH